MAEDNLARGSGVAHLGHFAIGGDEPAIRASSTNVTGVGSVALVGYQAKPDV